MSFFETKEFSFKWKVFIPHKGWEEGQETINGRSYMLAYWKLHTIIKARYKEEKGANVFIVNEETN